MKIARNHALVPKETADRQLSHLQKLQAGSRAHLATCLIDLCGCLPVWDAVYRWVTQSTGVQRSLRVGDAVYRCATQSTGVRRSLPVGDAVSE